MIEIEYSNWLLLLICVNLLAIVSLRNSKKFALYDMWHISKFFFDFWGGETDKKINLLNKKKKKTIIKKHGRKQYI